MYAGCVGTGCLSSGERDCAGKYAIAVGGHVVRAPPLSLMLTRASACARSRRVYAPAPPRVYAPRPARVYARFSTAAPTLAFEPPPPEPERAPPPRLSDHEWELRTGRAIYILTQTLPNFFECGLVDSLDPAADGAGDGAALYAPHVRLEYTPPFSLPAPLPRTFWAQGPLRPRARPPLC
jgi:hypothetical protein